MYQASAAFHNAIASGAHQMALLLFPDCVFSNEDIELDSGLELRDYFQTGEDVEVGQALSNELVFTLFNDYGYLDDYEFGQVNAMIGVMIGTEGYRQFGYCTCVANGHTFLGSRTAPYLTRDGVTLARQPGFGVRSIIAYNGKIYCFGIGVGQYFILNEQTLQPVQETLPVFMRYKAVTFDGRGFWLNGKILYIYEGGTKYTYEFVPLGQFIVDRPTVPDDIRISFECNDLMTLFDDDMITLTYPITFKGILDTLCQHVGITNGATTFPNSTATLTEKPDEFDNCTMRDVIRWVAEAAGSIAKIDRDGKLQMLWFQQTTRVVDESGYVDFRPYWYTPPTVNKLLNRDTSKGTDTTVGSGTNEYLIQDNPLLKGVT